VVLQTGAAPQWPFNLELIDWQDFYGGIFLIFFNLDFHTTPPAKGFIKK